MSVPKPRVYHKNPNSVQLMFSSTEYIKILSASYSCPVWRNLYYCFILLSYRSLPSPKAAVLGSDAQLPANLSILHVARMMLDSVSLSNSPNFKGPAA